MPAKSIQYELVGSKVDLRTLKSKVEYEIFLTKYDKVRNCDNLE